MMLSRNSSFISHSYSEDWETPPLDKLNFFDLFDSLAIPVRLDKLQAAWAAQRERVRKQQERLRSTGATAKDRAIAELRKRVPTSEEQLDRYRKRMRQSVDQLSKRWNDTALISAREKVSFISAVLNVFISGYIIGACPEYYYYWFTIQFAYFMPIRTYTYWRKGQHYFLADLCYFVNILTLLSIWVFPQSKRLLIACYCLAFGNNAVAIVMWRNSLVFHSLDKVTSLFIHIMAPVTLHCVVHLTPAPQLHDRFPAMFSIKYSLPGSPQHYTLFGMLLWATIPYLLWQTFYHIFISVKRKDKIAAGRLTSFTWLRRSYAKTWLGRLVLRQPENRQEITFMLIQYTYALLTILPCPIWFWYRWASAGFLMGVFFWSIWNGANYYMDVFGKRFQKELEALRQDVARWQSSPDGLMISPLMLGKEKDGKGLDGQERKSESNESKGHAKKDSLDDLPPLDMGLPAMADDSKSKASGRDLNGDVTERRTTSSS